MTNALHHRGPDDSGRWVTQTQTGDKQIDVALGHTRLSILDLSPLGHQPMSSGDDQVTIAYNGEVYNYRELRADLVQEGFSFRSDCDTEVILQAYRAWGLEMLPRLVGMFALAIWDDQEKQLVLARDRLGIKPLYYRFSDEVFTFASQLSALRLHSAFDSKIDVTALGNFFRYGNCTGRQSIYQDTFHLAPGEVLIWRNGEISRRPYWQISNFTEEDGALEFDAVVNKLEEILGQAVEQRMIADVPLGAFLSGGIDSTAVVALMQEHSRQPVRTFSIGFHDESFDEAPFASSIAKHLKTEHTDLYVQREDARAVAVELPDIYDEPFADSSAIPTTLLSRITRNHVTVSLSGDGGDELFGGYRRYRKFTQLDKFRCLPRNLGKQLAHAAHGMGFTSIANGLQVASSVSNSSELAEHFLTHSFPSGLLHGFDDSGAFPCGTYQEAFDSTRYTKDVRKMMLAEACTYMVDDILTKVDRASMSISLEARVPLLDHRVVEFACGLPLKTLWHNGVAKAPLREIVSRRVPRALIDRPKMGFGIPIHSLLKEELIGWKKRHLAPDRIREDGLFDASLVKEMHDRSNEMGDAGAEYLWPLLCFQRWFARHHRGEGIS